MTTIKAMSERHKSTARIMMITVHVCINGKTLGGGGGGSGERES